MTTIITNHTNDFFKTMNNIIDNDEIVQEVKNIEIANTRIDNIIHFLTPFTSLTSLYLCMNCITKLSEEITVFKNLKLLRAEHNRITCIPHYIFRLTQLTNLDLRHNKIKTIPIKIKKLINLESLSIYSNWIEKIPKEIGELTKLTKLQLSSNRILEIPSEIGNLTKLTSINLSHNPIKSIPPEIKNLTKLVKLFMFACKLTSIPNEIGHLNSLDMLQLSGNLINEIPIEIGNLIGLKNLYIGHNRIVNIPNEMQNLINLEELYFNYNNLTEFPIFIINFRRLREIKFTNNNFAYIPPQFYRLVESNKNLYNDDQNIHDSNIQKSVKDSIIAITKQKIDIDEDKIMNSIFNDPILTTKTKQLLVEFSDCVDYHSVLLITFKELLMYVWSLIETNQYKDNIKEVLNTEILDSECRCFTGRLTRLLNCLNDFSDLVEIKISDNQQIGIIILNIKVDLEIKKEYTVETHKKLVVEELKSRGYADDLITEWVEQIEE